MKVQLNDILQEISIKTTINDQYPVLTSSKSGLYLQSNYFNKQVASKNNIGYKIIKRGQFTYRAMSDTGEFFPNMLECTDVGIVSPAYPVFEITNTDLILPAYLKYYFKSSVFQYSIASFVQGSTRTSVKYGKLKTISIELPTKEEQYMIVEILCCVEKIIAKRKTQLQQLDELVKSRFVEMFGDPVINDKKWTIDTLGNYMITLTDFSANGSYELLDSNVVMYDEPNYAIMVRTTDLESRDLTSGVKYIDEAAYKLLGKSKLFGGELIMNKIGSAGKIYIMPHIDRPASLGRNAFMFRFDDRLNMKYLYFLLSSEYGTNEIQQYVRGAVTKTITKDSTRAIKIIVPPINLQNKFATFVEHTDKSKVVVQKALDEAQTLFDSLMQEYFG